MIKQLSREGNHEVEEKELLAIVEEMEENAATPIRVLPYIDHIYVEKVAPWYYLRLAILYRKRKDYASEVAIIERHFSVPHNNGPTANKLKDRLVKAKALLEKQKFSDKEK